MVSLINMNEKTRLCKFSIDSANDLSSLPTKTTQGKDMLSTIKNCTQGSMAYSTDGKQYILSGETNEWVQVSYSAGSSSGSGGAISENIEPISKSDIESLFE